MAARRDPSSEDETYKVLDITEYARRRHWCRRRLFGHNSGPLTNKYSVATQIVMGGGTGWCVGFLFQKVGKLAATAVQGGFLLLQIASHNGYVQIDWKRVEKDVNKAKQKGTRHASLSERGRNVTVSDSDVLPVSTADKIKKHTHGVN
uniref:FUN14 domain-containing protein 1 n=1 Tax=Leptobrachium leishanense TaxID=445787 RepID=A0A8C5Q0K1_9ANUR